jgi:hypothetical protein
MLQEYDFEIMGVPLNSTTTAIAGDWINLKNARYALLVLAQGAWDVDVPAVTLLQATDNAGANAKALSFSEQWSKVAITGGKWARADVLSDTFNLTAVDNTVTAIEISAEMLDRDNNFTHVSLAVADAGGSNPDLSGVLVILGGLRYQGDPATVLDDPKL